MKSGKREREAKKIWLMIILRFAFYILHFSDAATKQKS